MIKTIRDEKIDTEVILITAGNELYLLAVIGAYNVCAGTG